MLALHVNGADLTPDHGYPARVIVQAGPGVHNTKWVRRITFGNGRLRCAGCGGTTGPAPSICCRWSPASL